MLKLTVAIMTLALAGTASAGGWRSLRVDASSEDSFVESVATLQDKLSPSRRVAFDQSLRDIWQERAARATAEQREYTNAEYLRELDGLGYEEVTRLADPSGERAKRYRAQYYYSRAGGSPGGGSAPSAWSTPAPPPVQNGIYRGWTTSGGIRMTNNSCGC